MCKKQSGINARHPRAAVYLRGLLRQVERDALADFGRQLCEHLGLETTDHDLAQPLVQLLQVGRAATVPLPARAEVPARERERSERQVGAVAAAADAFVFPSEEKFLRKHTYLRQCPEGIVKTHLNIPTWELPGTTTALHRLPLSSSAGAVGGSVFCLRALCRAGNYFV